VSFVTSTPLKRQDHLSGFKPCEGNFPNTITELNYEPKPAVTGQNITVHISGKATEVVQQGTMFVPTAYKKNEPNKPEFQHQIDYSRPPL